MAWPISLLSLRLRRSSAEEKLAQIGIHIKLRLGFLSLFLLLLATGVLSRYCLTRATEGSLLVSHTHEVLVELQALSSSAHKAVAETRAHLVSPSDKQQADFQEARQKTLAHLARLRFLTADNPAQQRRLDVLTITLDRFLARDETQIRSKYGKETAVVANALTSEAEERDMRQLEAELEHMTDEENMLLQRRIISSHDSSFRAGALLGIATLLGALFIAFGSFRIDRELYRREQAEAELRQAREALEQRVRERTADLSNTTVSLRAEMAERQKALKELRQSEERYRLFFEENPLPMEIFDPETLAYLAVNKAAQELYGYTREEFLSMTLKDTRPAEEVPALLEFLDKVKTAEFYSATFSTKHKSGKLITIDAKVRTIQYGDREVRLKLVTDVTQHKQLETRLQQSQKIEAVGRLAGGIAHDFNNLLTLILGHSDNILHELDADSQLRSEVLEIRAAGRRAANLTRQLLAFSRKQILKPQVLQLNSIVGDIAEMLRRLLGEDIHISLHLDTALGQVRADPTQFEQVLINLAVNARDAMPDGGQLVIETRNIELDQHTAALQSLAAGRYVVVTVSDTGCGMDEETKSRVFEPFFTTKEVGKGTGLGLSMVLGVVQQSGGTVSLYSEPGIGTAFKIYLPRLDSIPEVRPVEEIKPRSWQAVNEATILLVEDEPSLRALARKVLLHAGYKVLEAGNGKEALQVAKQLAAAPDLLLTDVVMPEMSGLELADQLHKQWPHLAVVYTSGYTDHALLERNTLRQEMPFLQKPYMPEAMLEQVGATLGNNRRTNTSGQKRETESAESLATQEA